MAGASDNAKYIAVLIGQRSVNLGNSVEVWAIKGYHKQYVEMDIADMRQLLERLEKLVDGPPYV